MENVNALIYKDKGVRGAAFGAGSLCIFVVGLYVFHIAFASIAARGFYMDGANFFVGLLSGNSAWAYWDDDKHARLFVNVLNQLPVSLALFFGSESVVNLRLLFNIGLFFTPFMIYFLCFFLSVRSGDLRVFTCAATGFILFIIPSESFILNQAFTAAAISWLVMHYALLDIKLSRIDYFIVFAAIVILFRSHESVIIWGVLISIAALVAISRRGVWRPNKTNSHRYFIALAGVAQAGFLGWWQITHPLGEQTESYLALFGLLDPAEMWSGNTRLTLVVFPVLLVVLTLELLSKHYKYYRILLPLIRGLVAVGSAFALYYGFTLFSNPWLANPFREYQYRFLITFGTAAMMAIAVMLPRIAGSRILRMHRHSVVVVLCCAIGATTWQISNTINWHAFKQATTHTLAAAGEAVVSPEVTRNRLNDAGLGYLSLYGQDWTWSALGLGLQSSTVVSKIYKPESHGDYLRLPDAERLYPSIPFVEFTENGIFEFEQLRLACSEQRCE